MKKIILSLIVLAFAAGSANLSAQGSFRSKYRNISFVDQELTFADMTFKSDFGAAFTSGRSYIVTPVIGGFFRAGIDATWFDINYANFKFTDGDEKSALHNADISVHIGASVHFTPISKLGVHGYFRYAPTYSVLYDTSETRVAGGYGSIFVSGGAVSFGVISVGAEYRWGKGNYSQLYGKDGEDGEEIAKLEGKFDTGALRAYVSFRF